LENTIYIVAGIVVLLLLARYFAKRRGTAVTSEAQVRAKELQSYLASCVDDLRQVLAQKGKEPENIRREAYEILARMESRNTGGNLDDFIQDNRESVDLALRRGDAA
jgi:hypothetical protein